MTFAASARANMVRYKHESLAANNEQKTAALSRRAII
jgi:hypothetical protein